LDILAGDTLRADELVDRLEKNRRKVFNLNLFLTVKAELVPTQTNKVSDLVITVQEQWYIFPFPVFFLADRNLNEWWTEKNGDLRRTTIGLALRHRNFRGRAEELKLNIQFGFTNYYEFFYRIPYIDKAQKMGITSGISYTTNKTLRYKTWADKLIDISSENQLRDRFYANIILRRRQQFYGFQFLELRYNYNRIADTVALANPNYFLNQQKTQQYLQLAYTYTYDFRDKIQYPLRGYVLSVQANKVGLLPSDDLNLIDLSVSFARYQSFGKGWFGSIESKLRTSAPNQQPFLQTRGLGYGSDLVRGYELYVIDGQSFGYLKSNIKFQALDEIFDIKRYLKIKQFGTFPLAIYPVAFFDIGYSANRFSEANNSKLANKLLWGTGLGVDFVGWYNGVFRLSYAYNKEGQSGFRFDLGRAF
jgi:outer membrane protein assembly factor BamA